MRETSIKYTLDLQDFIASVKQIPNITDQQLDKMVRVWVRRNNQVTKEMAKAAKEAEKAAAAAARANEDAAARTRRAWDATKKVLEGVGGPLGELAGRAQNFGEGLSSAAGAAGVAAAAVAVLGIATARAVAEVWRFADGARESLSTLEEMGLAATLPPEAVERIREWESAANAMRIAAMQAHVEIASLLTPSMVGLADAALGARRALDSLREGMGDQVGGWMQAMADEVDLVVVAMESQGLAGRALATVYRMLAASGSEHRAELDAQLERMREIEAVAASIEAQGPVWDPQADAAHRAAKAAKALAEAQREAAAEARAQLSAEAMLYELRSDTLTAEQRAIDAAERRAAQLDELAAAGADAALIEQARLENTRRLTRELAEIERQRHEESARLDAERMARIEAMYREQTRLAEEAARAELQAQRQVEDAAVQMYGGLSRLASAYADAVVSGREDMTDAEQRAALAAFEMSRATALAQIAIQQGLAIARALAELGPIAGPIAAIGIGAEVLAQGIAIAQQPPPQFPTGGVVTAASLGLASDHGLVGVQAGEGIVSRRGMEALGEDGLAAINRGEPPVQRVEVVMQYRHRIFDRFVRDNLQRSGPLASAIGGGRRVGHYGV